MTVSAAVPVINYTGNGVSTVFSFDFKIFKASDLEVTVNGSVVTNYTVFIAQPPNYGGSILFSAPPGNGAAIRLKRIMPLERSVDYQQGGALPESTLDDDQDAAVMMVQQVAADLDNRMLSAVRAPTGEQISALVSAAGRANRLLGFGPTGDATTYPLPGGGGGGGQAPLQFQQAGSPVGGPGSFATINFASGFSLTDAGGGVVDVSGAFLQSGSGAVSRNAQTKIREVQVTPQDFGAVADGAANDYTAVVNCIAAHRRVRFPAGTYRLAFSGTNALTPLSNSVWEGDGKNRTTLRFEPNSSSYRNLIQMLNDGLTIKDMTLLLAAPSGAVVVMIMAQANGLTLERVKLDGGMTNVGPVLSHEAHGIKVPNTGTQTDFVLRDCDITRIDYGFLKENAATSTQRRVSAIGCHFFGNYGEDWGVNSPNGTAEGFLVDHCYFSAGAGAGASREQLYVAFASATNFAVINCSVSGTAAEFVHIEEGCQRFIVANNVGSINGTGIQLTDNNVGGTYKVPEQGTISNNTIRKEGTPRSAGSNGIFLVNDASPQVPGKNITIIGNSFTAFESGIYSALTLDDASDIAGNVLNDCTNGLRVTESTPNVHDNVSVKCAVGILSMVGSSIARHTFIDCTAKVTAQARPVRLIDPVIMTPEFNVTAGSTTVTPLFPLTANDRLYGLGMQSADVELVPADTAIRAEDVSWDGTTFTVTARLTYQLGGITLTHTRASNSLNSSMFSASARNNVRLQWRLQGLITIAP